MNKLDAQILTPAFCEAAAAIHKTGFDFPWSCNSFASLLNLNTTYGWINQKGLLVVSCLGDELEILTVCVLPKARGQGVGSSFLEFLFGWAKEKNVKRLFLEVSVQNEAAKRLYLKHGFQQIGVRKNYYKTKTGFCDAICMEKVL